MLIWLKSCSQSAESRDGMTTNKPAEELQCLCRSEKSGIYTHRHVYTLLYVLSNVVKCIGEKFT